MDLVDAKRPVGRPGRYAKYEEFEAKLPKIMPKRARYYQGIGICNGATGSTVYLKIRLPRGGTFRGRSYAAGEALEFKIGNRASWDWPKLIEEHKRFQGLADRGEPLEAVEVETFATYSIGWLDRRKPTMRSYGVTKGHVVSVLNPTFGKKTLDAITVGDVNRWISQQAKKLKPSSIQRQLNTFKAIMNDAVRNEIIKRNPVERADKLKGIEPRLRFVSDDDLKVVLKAADNIEQDQEANKERTPHRIRGWLRFYVIWAYQSGMRREEILNLTWERIREGDNGVTAAEVTHTKTGNPRNVTCTDEMLSILVALRKLERVEGDERLFPISMTTLKRALTKLWKATGLDDIRLHDMRSTHATILLENGVDAHIVSGRLGHSRATLLKHYAVYRGDVEAAKTFSARSAKAERVPGPEFGEEIAVRGGVRKGVVEPA